MQGLTSVEGKTYPAANVSQCVSSERTQNTHICVVGQISGFTATPEYHSMGTLSYGKEVGYIPTAESWPQLHLTL